MKVSNHRLLRDTSQAIDFKASPNQDGTITPLYLIMHYTASSKFDGAVAWFSNPQAQASAHVVIGRSGELVQMVAFNRAAWHAGKSHWGELDGLNQFSIGIELVNAGQLIRSGQQWSNWAHEVIPDEQVTVLQHKHGQHPTGWQTFTAAQLAVALEVALALQQRYRFKDVLGHDDVAPGRKLDPGPAFALSSFRSKVLGRK